MSGCESFLVSRLRGRDEAGDGSVSTLGLQQLVQQGGCWQRLSGFSYQSGGRVSSLVSDLWRRTCG